MVGGHDANFFSSTSVQLMLGLGEGVELVCC